MHNNVPISRPLTGLSNDGHGLSHLCGGWHDKARDYLLAALLSIASGTSACASGTVEAPRTSGGASGGTSGSTASAAGNAQSSGTLCQSEEVVAFSCPTATKIVSLCAKPEAGPAAKQLAYRYGTAKKVELEYVATADNGKRFGATASPAAPGASVHQLWFNRGDIRYLLTECVGGSCPHGAGVAVLNPEKVLMSARCVAGDTPSQAFFSRSLIEFGNGADDTRAHTELIKIEDSDNSLDKIYKAERPPR
ncbi:hypothetical protein [Roseateles sp.]|jgi:hypothetical protein|uniref:hypothetical protein n=1 Tax=Roseateles sp. TaxID=1971397 RepID=UPI0031CECEE8